MARSSSKRRAAVTLAADPIEGARTFLSTQEQAMREWDNSALPNRREHETALAYLHALLDEVQRLRTGFDLLAPERSDRPCNDSEAAPCSPIGQA